MVWGAFFVIGNFAPGLYYCTYGQCWVHSTAGKLSATISETFSSHSSCIPAG
jgi:hypothetical protein